MHLFAPMVALVQQVSYYLPCWFCNLMFSFGLYLSLRQFFWFIWLVRCTVMKLCAPRLGLGKRSSGREKGAGLLVV